jgi:hypothetical protein
VCWEKKEERISEQTKRESGKLYHVWNFRRHSEILLGEDFVRWVLQFGIIDFERVLSEKLGFCVTFLCDLGFSFCFCF